MNISYVVVIIDVFLDMPNRCYYAAELHYTVMRGADTDF